MQDHAGPHRNTQDDAAPISTASPFKLRIAEAGGAGISPDVDVTVTGMSPAVCLLCPPDACRAGAFTTALALSLAVEPPRPRTSTATMAGAAVAAWAAAASPRALLSPPATGITMYRPGRPGDNMLRTEQKGQEGGRQKSERRKTRKRGDGGRGGAVTAAQNHAPPPPTRAHPGASPHVLLGWQPCVLNDDTLSPACAMQLQTVRPGTW